MAGREYGGRRLRRQRLGGVRPDQAQHEQGRGDEGTPLLAPLEPDAGDGGFVFRRGGTVRHGGGCVSSQRVAIISAGLR